MWTVLTFAMAAVATVLTANLGVLIPALSSRAAAALALVVIYVVFGTINVLGVERGARAGHHGREDPAAAAADRRRNLRHRSRQSLVAQSAGHGDARAQQPAVTVRVRRRGGAGPGGEVKDPARTVPRALLIGMTATTALYAALQFVCQACSGRRSRLRRRHRRPRPPRRSVDGQRACSSLGRGFDARTRRRDDPGHAPHAVRVRTRWLLPAALARLHPAHHTPVAAIVLQCVLDVRCSRHQHVRASRRSREPVVARGTRPAARPPGSFAAAMHEPADHRFESRPPEP